MKKIILAASLACAGSTFAQVGINTTTPQSTFDVVGDPDNTTKFDGIIAPRITGNQLTAKTYTTAQTGAMVYVTAAASTLTSQVINVSAPGYYYFDGTVWQVFKASSSANDAWKTTGNAGTDATNFLGTTDDVSLNFRVNNMPAGHIDSQLSNVFYGLYAGQNTSAFPGIANTAMGNSALRANTTGQTNTAIGSSSLQFNTTGGNNTAVGVSAMASNTDGYSNSAFGGGALAGNTTGLGNTALGTESLPSNTTGEYNIGIGGGSLFSNTTGNQNIGLGNYVLSDKITGDNNIALGNLAGQTLTAGSNNIFIGQNAVPTISTTGSNQLNIGNWIYGDNGKIGLGTATMPTNQLHVRTIANPVRLEGLQAGASTDQIVVVDATGVLKTLSAVPNLEPWYNASTASPSTSNADNIYIMGNVGVGTTTITSTSSKLTLTDERTAQNTAQIAMNSSGGSVNFVSNLAADSFNKIADAGDRGLIFSMDNNPAAVSTNGFVIASHSGTTRADGIKIMEDGRVGISVDSGSNTSIPNSILQVGGSFSAPIRTGSGVLSITDYTILGSGDITLPDPTTVTGRIYNIIYDGVDFTITGLLRNNGTNFPTYGMNAGNPTKKVTVQSNGTRWVIY